VTAPLAIIRTYEGMLEAFHARKAGLGLSNEECERLAGLTKGHLDKQIGPSRVRNITPMMFDVLCELFAVELHLVVNVEAAERMAARWERRDDRAVRVNASVISKSLIDKAKPVIFREIGVQLREARKKLKPSTRRRIARQAARARWRRRKLRKSSRSAGNRKSDKP
jgi:hypothetical protein